LLGKLASTLVTSRAQRHDQFPARVFIKPPQRGIGGSGFDPRSSREANTTLAHEARHIYQFGSEDYDLYFNQEVQRLAPPTWLEKGIITNLKEAAPSSMRGLAILSVAEGVGLVDTVLPNQASFPMAFALAAGSTALSMSRLKNDFYESTYWDPSEVDARRYEEEVDNMGDANPWLGVISVESI